MAKNCNNIKDKYKGVKKIKLSFKKSGRKKPMMHDIFAITPKILGELFFGSKKEALIDIAAIMKNPEIYKHIKKNMDISTEDNIITSFISDQNYEKDSEKAGHAMKYMSLALSEVISAMESGKNVAKTAGVTNKSLKETMKNEDGSMQLNLLNIAQTIGEQIMTHNGVKLKAEPHKVKLIHKEQGLIALGLLEDAGIITLSDNGTVVNPGYRNDTLQLYRKNKKNLTLSGFETVSLNIDSFLSEDQKSKDYIERNRESIIKALEESDQNTIMDFDKLYETINGISAVKRLVVPSNFKPPMNEGELVDESNVAQIKDLGDGSADSPGITPRHDKLLN